MAKKQPAWGDSNYPFKVIFATDEELTILFTISAEAALLQLPKRRRLFGFVSLARHHLRQMSII